MAALQIFLVCAGAVAGIILLILSLRRIVPSNMGHILQRSKSTVSYGVGMKAGNTYYKWPAWIPLLGVTVRELPVSNFDLDLVRYEAYDKNRLPFTVDVKAFFRIEDTNAAAQKVENLIELKDHLMGIVQGSVRSIMAKSDLESIMEERSIYGEQFTRDVRDELAEWGVVPVKNIELMDIQDAKDSNVIVNIMAKKKSEIEKESRVTVAINMQKAQEAEIEAAKDVEVKKAAAEQSAGEAQAKSSQAVGIARQKSEQAVAEEKKITAEKNMAVEQVNTVKAAEIAKEAAIVAASQQKETLKISADAGKYQKEVDAQAQKSVIEIDAEAHKNAVQKTADAEKYRIEQVAEATLVQQQNEAKGKQAVGLAEAEAKKAQQLAGVTAQTTLAREVGENKEYQQYLIAVEQIRASRDIGIEQAKNIGKADIKILANSGDIQGGIEKIAGVFSSKGGSALNGLFESLKQTPEGEGLVKSLLKRIAGAGSEQNGSPPSRT
jgi:flotillin